MRQGFDRFRFPEATEEFIRQKAAQIWRLVPSVNEKIRRDLRLYVGELPINEFLSERYIEGLVRLCLQMWPDVAKFTHIVSDEESGRDHAIIVRKLVNLMRQNLYTDASGESLPDLGLEFLHFNEWQMEVKLERHIVTPPRNGQKYDYRKVLLVTEMVETGHTALKFKNVLQGLGFEEPAVAAMLISGDTLDNAYEYAGGKKFRHWPYYYMGISKAWGIRPENWDEYGEAGRPIHLIRPEYQNQVDLNVLRELEDWVAETVFWQVFGDDVRPQGQV